MMTLKVIKSVLYLIIFTLPLNSAFAKEVSVTKDGLKIFFSSADLFKLSNGLTESIKDETLSGTLSRSFKTSFSAGELTVDGISYSIGFSEIRMVPHNGYLRSFVSIDLLRISVKNLKIKHLWTSECNDIVITGSSTEITGRFDSDAKIIDSNLSIIPKKTILSLDGSKLYVSSPTKCTKVLGASLIVSKLIPKMVRSYTDEIAESIESFTNNFIEEKVKGFSEDFLNLSLSLPMKHKYLRPLFYTVQATPRNVSITTDGITYSSDLGLKIETEKSKLEPLGLQKKPEPPVNIDMSYIGIHKNFFTAILNQLYEEGMFNLKITGDLIPKVASLQTPRFLENLLPGLSIAENETVSWEIISPSDVDSELFQLEARTGVNAKLNDLGLLIETEHSGSYMINLNLEVPFISQVQLQRRKLQLGLLGLRAKNISGVNLSNGENLEVSHEKLTEVFKAILSGLTTRSMLEMDIYDFDMGTMHIGIGGIVIKDNYLTFNGFIEK